MASMSYPPFSAPPSIERRKKAKNRSFLQSAKEAFSKPWKKASKKPRKQPARPPIPQHNPSNMPVPGFKFSDLQRNMDDDTDYSHGNVPLPFAGNRLSPDGGSSSPYEDKETKNDFDIPETAYGSRPPLSNIFEIDLNGKNSASAPKPTVPQAPPPKQPAIKPTNMPVSPQVPTATTPKITPTPPALSSPYLAPPTSSRPLEERRHSTPVIPSLSAPTTPRDRRRPSASSDNITVDKLRNHRRERRSSGTREIPLLPRRGQDPFQCSSHSSTMSTPDQSVSPYSEFNGLPTNCQQQALIDPSDPQLAAVMMGLPMSSQRPPVGPGGGVQVEGHPQQVWVPPHQQLQELQEELDYNDEPDGAETFLTRIEEIEEVDYQHPPRLSNPKAEQRLPVVNRPQEQKSGGPGATGKQTSKPPSKQGSKPASKKSGQNKKTKQQGGNVLAKEQEPGHDIKGFDGFFMY